VNEHQPQDLKARAQALIERARYAGPTVRRDQLIGVDACLHQLAGQIRLLERPELGERFGLEPSGTLFLGPPGTGKTLLARYLAGMLSIPLYQLSADEFEGDPALLHAVFARLADQRALLFIDEISILAQSRNVSDAQERRMLAALLTELDGLAGSRATQRLWVIGACTPDITLDSALYRSGRLGVTVEFAHPSELHRRQLFELYLKPVPHKLTRRQIAMLAQIASTATGADIRDWVNQAASEALAETARDEPVIRYRHLEAVVARRGFVAATERPGGAPDQRVAIHEAGHAVVAWALFGPDALGHAMLQLQLTRGRRRHQQLGHFELSEEWLATNPPTSTTWRDHVAIGLAGACAELEVLGDRGPGASSDIHTVTGEILQLLELGDPDFGPARSRMEADGYGTTGAEVMRALAWRLTRARFEETWEYAMTVVRQHRQQVVRVADELMFAGRSLSGYEIASLLTSSVSTSEATSELASDAAA
jgi:ATP-dependent Zn protease